MAQFTVLTKYGYQKVSAVQMEYSRGGRILVLTAPHCVPMGTEMLNGKFLKKDVLWNPSSLLHKTRRHSKSGEDPRYDVMEYGLPDLHSRLVRVKMGEEVTEPGVVRVTLQALGIGWQRVLRYRYLPKEELSRLVPLRQEVADSLKHAEAELKVQAARHLRHASTIFDSSPKPKMNPGKTKAALVAAKAKMLARGKEVAAISGYISADLLACESEIDRIINIVYEPIHEMVMSWIDYHKSNRSPGGGLRPEHLRYIREGFQHGIAELQTVVCAPYAHSAQVLIGEMRAVQQLQEPRAVVKVLKQIRARIRGERARTQLLAVNAELGFLERAKHLSPEEYGKRLNEALHMLRKRSNEVVRRTGLLRKSADRVRDEFLKLLPEMRAIEARKRLRKLRAPIKQLADMVNV